MLNLKNISLVQKGLRYKTLIAFSLMSLIPLLVTVWLATCYIFPNINIYFGLSLGNISFILFISLMISLLGLYLTKEMIDPIIKIAGDAKIIASGDIDKRIDIKREDEIGDLSTSLNIMTQKIKENLEELKAYGERTKLINIEINKKVLALSGLLQIGNLISSSTDLITNLDFIAQKISDVEEGAIVIVMILDSEKKEFKVVSHCNISNEKIEGMIIKEYDAVPQILYKDKNTYARAKIITTLLSAVEAKNIAILPILVSGKQHGIIVLANNREDFIFKEEERELLKVFVKQAAIAVENDLLIKKAKELAVIDELTGLYNQSYIHARLDEEIKRACIYQRPCGYLLVDVDNFRMLHNRFGELRTAELLKMLGEILKGSVTEVDKVARLTLDKFAVVLPEKNKRQSAAIAEDIRKKVEAELCRRMKVDEKITVTIGVSENPIDGSTADELEKKAERLVRDVKMLGKNRVGV